MKCHYCGAELAGAAQYCINCGTRQEGIRLADPAPAADFRRVDQLPEPEPVRQELPVRPQPPAAPAPVAVKTAEEEFPVIRPKARRIPPRVQLPVKRGLGKMFFLSILTLGIYPTVIWSRIVAELNIAASRYDGKRTVSYFGMLMLAPITLGIFSLVWMHRFCDRIGQELVRRRIDYKFGATTFWLWNVLGSLIIVGPFIFVHKLMKSMNKINADFNVNG